LQAVAAGAGTALTLGLVQRSTLRKIGPRTLQRVAEGLVRVRRTLGVARLRASGHTGRLRGDNAWTLLDTASSEQAGNRKHQADPKRLAVAQERHAGHLRT
jgi:hypothetical protein